MATQNGSSSGSPAMLLPTGEPAARRKFQLTDLDGNHNKFYLVETWNLSGDQVYFRATYGRVGATAQVDEKVATPAWVERKIREKQAKGYREVSLYRPAVPVQEPEAAVSIHPKVQQLVDYIYAEAGEKIASFLAVGLDALSPEQIALARKLLFLAQAQYQTWKAAPAQAVFHLLAGTVQSFYNAVPTQLPHRIEAEKAVLDFCQALDEYEDRLNQLEAALATLSVQQARPQMTRYEALGAELDVLAETDPAFKRIHQTIERTCVHSYRVRVRDIFQVTVPEERRAYEHNTRGQNRVELLFHGTASQNVRHILRSGLICPKTPSHGRMFGHGIYFADKVSKSANYCSVRHPGRPACLFLADVALGQPFVASQAASDWREAPTGYDSVLGQAGHTTAWAGALQFNEYIVYHAAQQTLRYIVLFER